VALHAGLAQQLRARFECPVLDLYTINETGPIGVHDAVSGGHVLLQHRLFVELLDSNGHHQPPGTRGEITITGGFNFCLPVVRYRTGDQASLVFDGSGDPC
jgi:phenylacetate-CoA ligase